MKTKAYNIFLKIIVYLFYLIGFSVISLFFLDICSNYILLKEIITLASFDIMLIICIELCVIKFGIPENF